MRPGNGIYDELDRLRADNAALVLAVRSLIHWAVRLDEHGERDQPLDDLPDGHAYEVVWGSIDTEYDTAFTAGQVKRALALLGPKPEVTGLAEAEKREQGRKCSCRGTDDMCPCQNVRRRG